MKGCELCNQPARMYCESDGASLCWDCDAKVHSANFLVAKHSRSLLCHACQSPTPWIASGTDLGRTFSVCISCASRGKHVPVAQQPQPEIQSRNDDDDRSEGNAGDEEITTDSEEEEECCDDSDYVSDEDEDGENQVVPWSYSPLPPCTAATSSSGRESCQLSPGGASSLKRMRHDSDISSSEDETECSSSISPPEASVSYEGNT